VRFAIICILVICLDQLTKFWVVQNFGMYESMVVVPGFFNLTYLTNTGAAFGMLAGLPLLWRQLFFVGVALVALVAIFFLHRKIAHESRWYTVSLALIAGGAVGNLIDRVRLGAVVDFLDVYLTTHHWPAFNVADSAISVGVVIFLVMNFIQSRNGEKT
jgi:signal peptidase II